MNKRAKIADDPAKLMSGYLIKSTIKIALNAIVKHMAIVFVFLKQLRVKPNTRTCKISKNIDKHIVTNAEMVKQVKLIHSTQSEPPKRARSESVS